MTNKQFYLGSNMSIYATNQAAMAFAEWMSSNTTIRHNKEYDYYDDGSDTVSVKTIRELYSIWLDEECLSPKN